MNCPFCNQPCPESNYFREPPNSSSTFGYKCDKHPHNVEIIASPEEQRYICYYVTSRPTIDQPGMFKEYLIGHHYHINGQFFYIWEGNMKRSSTRAIFTSSSVINITPDNIDTKLPTILLFL